MKSGLAALILAALPALAQQEQAQHILKETGVCGGLVVHVACGDGRLTAALHAGDSFVVQGLDADVTQARASIRAAGVAGPVSAIEWRGGALPYPDDLVRLIVIPDEQRALPEEILRVLAPGGVAWVAGKVVRKPDDPNRDGWTHYFYDAANNACSHDKVVGPPRSLQWFAGPISGRSHSWTTGTDSFVSDDGRVFYIMDEGPIASQAQGVAGMNWAQKHPANAMLQEKWALIARDAYSGVLLWKRPLTGFGEFEFEDAGPAQATVWNVWSLPLQVHRRVVVQGRRVFATLAYRGGLTALDATTGKTLWEYQPKGLVDEVIATGGRILLRVRGEIPAKLDGPILAKNAVFMPGLKVYGPERYADYLDSLPPEQVAAVDAATGKELWRVGSHRVATETLCAAAGTVCYYDNEAVVCRDAATGKELWRSSQEHRVDARSGNYGRSGNVGNLFIWQNEVYFSAKGTVCLSLADGKELWRSPRIGAAGGFGHPTGLRIVNGVLYNDVTARADALTGKDLGPLVNELAIGSTHGRCHRGVATDRYLCGIRFGIEFYDIAAGKMVSDDRWLRSSCALGYVPANGLLYHAPDPCSCWIGARIRGFHAMGPQAPALDYDKVVAAERLEKGPAYGRHPQPAASTRHSEDWPVYRHDIVRSGQAATTLATALKPRWTADIGGKITPPVVAGGRVYVSRTEANEVICLDAGSGKVVWRCETPSYVDSAPTVAGGWLVFGCADGKVYCLDAADGALAWRFRVAPAEMMIVDDGRMASKWPVSGSLLVQDGAAYAPAGRSSFLDGGIQVAKLDVATGTLLNHTRLDGPWYLYETNSITGVEEGEKAGMKIRAGYYPRFIDAEGARDDLLVGDGRNFHMGSTQITPDLTTLSDLKLAAEGKPAGGRHLRAITGFLDDTYFSRTGWHYSDQYYGAGNAAGAANAGKILVFDDQFTYASQHEGQDYGRYPNHLLGKGSTLNADKNGTANQHKGFDVIRQEKPIWTLDVPLIVRAMLLAPGQDGKVLFVAGPNEAERKDDSLDVYEYQTPGHLWALSAKDGRKLAEVTFDACPVFDGLAAAAGKVFVSQVNGRLVCLEGK